jgi:hypothetical protein
MIILNVNIQERSAKRGKCELYLDTIKQIKETKRTTTVPSLYNSIWGLLKGNGKLGYMMRRE